MSWSPDEARKLATQILSYSHAKECEITLVLNHAGHTRFAANDVTTSGSVRRVAIRVTSRDGRRTGVAATDTTELAALKRAVAESEDLMAAAAPDPEYVENLGPQKYPDLQAFSEDTAKARAMERRAGVQSAIDLGRAKNLSAAGFSETDSSWSAIANKRGNFGFFRATVARFSTTLRTADATGSGWAGLGVRRFSDLPTRSLVERAAQKAEASAKPRPLEPGRYPVILEPQAVADLLSNFGSSLSQRAADEGRSFMSRPGGGNQLGEQLFPASVTLRTDPFDPRSVGRPWAGGAGGQFLGFGGFNAGNFFGLPAEKTTWIENGAVKALSVDRYWAKRNNLNPRAYAGTVILEGGSGTLDQLIASTDRALLITRLHYIRSVNPQTVELTGLTRDGVWMIEKGKVSYPVNNFRWNESVVTFLKNVEAMTVPAPTGVRVEGGGGGGGWILPAVRAKSFNLTSASDAV